MKTVDGHLSVANASGLHVLVWPADTSRRIAHVAIAGTPIDRDVAGLSSALE